MQRYRPKPPYADPRPNSKIGRIRTALMYLVDEHRRDGMLPTSVRFLFYELVMKRLLSKEGDRPDKIVSAALTDLRERGHVPWHYIVDETRSVEDFTGSPTVAADLLAYLEVACIDPWDGDPPFLLTESRSLAGVLRATVEEFRNRISSTNGKVGGFLHTDIAPLLQVGSRVGYLGDLDLAGGDIEDNTRRVLEEIVGGKLNWERLALTQEQVDHYNLPIITKRDKRFNGDDGVHEAIETEALSQSLIIDIVRDWFEALLPEPLERVLVREQEERASIRKLFKRT